MPGRGDVDLDDLAARAERFTGADLEDLTRRAGLTALRGSVNATTITMADFDAAFAETRASVTEEMEQEYEKLRENLKQDAMAPGLGFISPGMLKPRGSKGSD